MVIGGRPSAGKTAFGLALAKGAAEAGTGVLFCSLEMPEVQIMERLVASEARVDARLLRAGRAAPAQVDDMLGAVRRISSLPGWTDDGGSQSAAHIAANARRLKASHGIGLVVVDYAGLMKMADPRRPRHEQVGECSRSLKALAKELSLPVILLCQLGRAAEGVTPQLHHLKETGDLEQDADTVLLLHRPDVTRPELAVIVAKQRSGPTGECRTVFRRSQMRFEDPGVSVPEWGDD